MKTLTQPPENPPSATPDTDANAAVLAVDLDGTLLRSDMLFEGLWSAMGRDLWATVRAAGKLRDGRAPFKRAIADLAEVDVTTLPYDAEVVDKVKAWRVEGGRAALVTATDQDMAEAVAEHLDIFDEVHGSDGVRNLKGVDKASFLIDRFPGGYTYIGDSAADLVVWEQAERAISVGASSRVRAALDSGSTPAEHLEREAPIEALSRAMRPQQWLKNLLVLVPLVADPSYGAPALLPVLAAFLSLSLAASAGYLINDLLDLTDDRSHPRKRSRPFASGALSTALGTVAIPILLVAALVLALLVSPALLAVVALYFVATVAYSVRLKQHTLIDICVLAFLFTLRIIAGGVAMGSPLSAWILAFSMFIFFALAAVKRLAELTDSETAGREASRRGYQPEDRRVVSQMAITSGYLAVLVLALYVDEPATQAKFGAPWLLWGICPLLIFWISRLVLVADRGEMHDDPMIFAMTNSTSRLVVAFCAVLTLGAVFL
ncbi:UbiA family prenyltransferase [Gymnodinialimonas hymeniacidonis]|uniref:UbiA family prenyltransferase n=1 Tax=Gymnodinialimonas hymeniacidonis TaxID=3126508 RepID=UPI0034C5B74D